MKIAIVNQYTCVSPWKEKWEEQMRTWIPYARKLGIPVYSLIANPNVKEEEKDYIQVDNFIHFDGKMRFAEVNPKYSINISYATNSALQWAKDQDLDYLLLVDNDVFVEPLRLLNLFQKYQHAPSIIYAGHCVPYLGWDFTKYPCTHVKSPPNRTYFASGGAGIILSKKGIEIAASNFLEELEQTRESYKYASDYILGCIFKKHNIPLFQDGRLFVEFPGKPQMVNPNNIPIPYIGDINSHLVCQHEANGHMDKIAQELGYFN